MQNAFKIQTNVIHNISIVVSVYWNGFCMVGPTWFKFSDHNQRHLFAHHKINSQCTFFVSLFFLAYNWLRSKKLGCSFEWENLSCFVKRCMIFQLFDIVFNAVNASGHYTTITNFSMRIAKSNFLENPSLKWYGMLLKKFSKKIVHQTICRY